MTIAFAIILGTLFGFVLHRVGASNPENIINMLRLNDLHLMKAIPLGIAIASLLLFGGLTLGLVDSSHVSVKSAYYGVIIGGALLGAGFALAGYCPGTAVTALGDGRKDAIFFILGGLVGAFIYTIAYGMIKDTWLMEKIAGGKVTLVEASTKYTALTDFGAPLAIGIAIVFIIVAFLLPSKKA